MPCTGVRRFRLWCHIYSLYPAHPVSRRRLGWIRLLPAPGCRSSAPPVAVRAVAAEPRAAMRRSTDVHSLRSGLRFPARTPPPAPPAPSAAVGPAQHPPRVHIAVPASATVPCVQCIDRALRNEHAPGIICFYYAPHDRPAAAAYWTDALPLDAKSGVEGRHTPSR